MRWCRRRSHSPPPYRRGLPGSRSPPDVYGDACQCGEGEGNGTIFASDATAIRNALTSNLPATSLVGRCSVAGGPECDMRDYVVLRRALTGLAPGISSVCSSAVRRTQSP